MGYRDEAFSELIGKTIETITGDVSSDELIFDTAEGNSYRMYHSQNCCESVSIEDIAGDLSDLIGSPILSAEAVSSSDPTPEVQAAREEAKAKAEANGDYYYEGESETWTFYKLSTIKGSVTIRWYGSSNGYYSESVDFVEI